MPTATAYVGDTVIATTDDPVIVCVDVNTHRVTR